MDMDQAAVFLAGSVLTMIGFVVVVIGIVTINNIIHKYWKPLGWSLFPTWASQEPQRFASQEELDRIPPEMEKKTGK